MSAEERFATEDIAGRCNHLVALLPSQDRARLLPELELVELPMGAVLFESGRPLGHGYFMTSAIVSRLHLLEDGKSAEVAVVGPEGFVGLTLLMGGGSPQGRALVQRRGHALRIRASPLIGEFNRGGPFMHVLLRYMRSLLAQLAQTSVCHSHHNADQKLCRWLLMRLDRQADATVDVTQDFIAQMLGVRRVSVTGAVAHLESEGLVSCSRGHITVLDRAGLESRCCECYRVMTREHAQIFPCDR
jgi:CRP-like cAMP-binding protein